MWGEIVYILRIYIVQTLRFSIFGIIKIFIL